jgi:hypothetical protein
MAATATTLRANLLRGYSPPQRALSATAWIQGYYPCGEPSLRRLPLVDFYGRRSSRLTLGKQVAIST